MHCVTWFGIAMVAERHPWNKAICKMGGAHAYWMLLTVLTSCIAGKVQSEGIAVNSAYGLVCKATDVVQATSTQQIAEAIKSYGYAADHQPVYIRATHKLYHSTASFPCAAATAGPADVPADKSKATTVDILMQDMNKVVAVNLEQQTITVQAGMTVTDMIKATKAAGMAVPLMAVPNYGGLTLGGIVATAATGTGAAGTTSTLCDIVISFQWVDGMGQIHNSDRHSDEGKAICGGLGVVGVITELTLKMQKPGKVAVFTKSHVPDKDLPNDIESMLQATPHVTVTWRPDLGKYTAYMFTASNSTDPINATIYTVDRPPSDAMILGQALKDWQQDVHTLNPVLNTFVCGLLAPAASLDIHWAVDLKTKQGLEYALADANDILSSECGSKDGSCSFTTVGHLGVGDIHFTIDRSKLGQWIDDVKSIIAKDLHGSATDSELFNQLLKKNAKKDCLPPGYFWLRFGQPSQDFVGLNSAPYKDPVHVQLSLFKSRAPGVAPMKNGHVLALVEQLTLCSYYGRPHFGKNSDRTFTYSKCPLSQRHPQWSSWIAAAKQHDPKGMFASPLVSTVLSGDSYTAHPGCGVTGGCYCETDEHCLLPGKPALEGWKCVASKAFPQYKACRPVLF